MNIEIRNIGMEKKKRKGRWCFLDLLFSTMVDTNLSGLHSYNVVGYVSFFKAVTVLLKLLSSHL